MSRLTPARYFTSWLFAIALISAGCAHNRTQIEPSEGSATSSYQALNSLHEITAESRSSINIVRLAELSGGTPLVEALGDPIQNLRLDDCMDLAAKSSPIANAINIELRQICSRGDEPPCLAEILQLVAQHERNESAGQAAEAFLNLAGVYLRHDILLESRIELEDAARIITKAKEANIPIEIDERALHRQQTELEESGLILRYGQDQLSATLRLLLDVEHSSSPIWTDWQSSGSVETIEFESALQSAWANRSDLRALELLIDCCSGDLMDAIPPSARSLSPFLGLAGAKLGVLGILPNGKRSDREACCKTAQIRSLIEARKKLIAAEIADLVFSIRRHIGLIKLKETTFASYQASIKDVEQRADLHPINLRTQLESKAKLFQVKADIVNEIINLEIALIKVKRVQGLLAR